jgi:hypothetical protein
MSAAGDIGGSRMGGVVVRFERRVASLAVITKLVDLGYLQPGARHRATAVERAIDRLRSDLVRQRVICDSNLSSSPKDEDRQGRRLWRGRWCILSEGNRLNAFCAPLPR